MKAWVPLLAMVISWLVARRLSRAGGRLLDRPNERSLHAAPVPRGGGAGILLGLAVAWVLIPDVPPQLNWIVLLGLGLGAFSLLDDLSGLPAWLRFVVQGILAAVLVGQGLWTGQISLPGMTWTLGPGLAMGLSWALLMWMTNLYNFMDGMDGFAGGMTVIGFSTLALLGWQAGSPAYALVCASIAAAAAGFLPFNFPPARLFMGDVGSAALGFMAGGLLLWADMAGLFPLWVGLVVFAPFVVDATVTLLRRLFRGERVWEAHRTHYYQRLVQAGWGHRKTVLREYALMLLCAAAAVVAVHAASLWQWVILFGMMLLFSGLILGLEVFLQRRGGRHDR